MRIISEQKLDFEDVLILPKRSTLESRSQVNLMRTFKFKNSDYEWTGIPIMASNMDTTGTFNMAKELYKHKLITCIHKHYKLDEWESFLIDNNKEILNHIAVSIGISDDDILKLSNIKNLMSEIYNYNRGFICIDVANGYTEKFIEQVKKIKSLFPKDVLIAGNVVSSEMVEELILVGVDIVKCGIGGGSACTTRIKTGVGYPQLSTVIECSDAAHGLDGYVVSDGGCTNSGSIAKAFGGGSDFVMLGGMLSGHNESGGDLIEENGKKYKEFYGMSSDVAMIKHYGKVNKYRASEGKRVLVPYRGCVEGTILDILGGVRSACTYVGAKKLKELSKRTTFIRVNKQSNEVYGKN